MSQIGEGKRRNEIAEWHMAWLAEWHNYAECNVRRMTQRNKLNWKVRHFLAPIKLQTQPLFWCCRLDIRWQSKSLEGSLLIRLFRTATKILLAFQLVGLHGSTDTTLRKSAIEEKMFWKVIKLPSALIFSARDVCTINLTVSFYLYLYLKLREKCFFFRRWVTWSWYNIQRWNGSCIKFPCASFLFFPSYRFSIFSRTNAHTQTNKESARRRGKPERRQRAVRFTRFLDFRLMFDSGRTFISYQIWSDSCTVLINNS